MVRAAKSLDVALAQLNRDAPNRSKVSDGGIGDAAHSARQSDHNPDSRGVFHARDFTHDPRFPVSDMRDKPHRLMEDPRAKYVIWDDWFYDRDTSGNIRQRPYKTVNPSRTNKHDKHLHLSVFDGTRGDQTQEWAAFNPLRKRRLLKLGNTGPDVEELQRALHVEATGRFGPVTDRYVRELQERNHLTVDGIVGPDTYRILGLR